VKEYMCKPSVGGYRCAGLGAYAVLLIVRLPGEEATLGAMGGKGDAQDESLPLAAKSLGASRCAIFILGNLRRLEGACAPVIVIVIVFVELRESRAALPQPPPVPLLGFLFVVTAL